MWTGIQDIITYATFYDDRLRGLGVAMGRISRFPIDLRRRPYNNLALPCEYVITFMGLRWRLRGVYFVLPNCKVVFGRKSSRQNRAKNSGFRECRGLNVKLFSNPKGHILARNRVVWRILRESQFWGLGCGRFEEPKMKQSKHFWCAISCILGKETHWLIVTKFCLWVQDLIMYAIFGDDGFGRGEGSHFRFPHWLPSSLVLPVTHNFCLVF